MEDRWPVTNHALVARLRAEGVTSCQEAGCEWAMTLELHHVNGNRRDNRRENLRLLCPNHHSLTPNWRNKRRPAAEAKLEPPP